ncbi:unnamed protein product [Microthlaspi erraticum]|uniref:Uncharacterized protein n=1 Tax=Microthlaspi erraticum TaxID=1685480 RepID=A0A6D2I4K9_9BRAS|nr:unnamed protein product [Microthlaspi erraticum]
MYGRFSRKSNLSDVSEKKILSSMETFLGLGFSGDEFVMMPQVLGYSMEKRIVPRCNVIKALMSKGLLRKGSVKMSSVLICTDEVFLRRYVRKLGDKELVAELMSILTGLGL